MILFLRILVIVLVLMFEIPWFYKKIRYIQIYNLLSSWGDGFYGNQFRAYERQHFTKEQQAGLERDRKIWNIKRKVKRIAGLTFKMFLALSIGGGIVYLAFTL